MKAYSTCVEAPSINIRLAPASVPLFQRAVAIDPDFAMAHARLGFSYSPLGESSSARQSLLKAYQLRERASDAERFHIETFYDRDVTGNLEREQQTLETWARTYPRDPAPTHCSRVSPDSTGQYELAIAETDKAIALDPDRGAAPTSARLATSSV